MKIEKKFMQCRNSYISYVYIIEYFIAIKSNVIEDCLMTEMFLKY